MKIFLGRQLTKKLHQFGLIGCALLASISCIKVGANSSLKVIGGIEDDESLPSTVRLEFPSKDNQFVDICTGAFVRDDLILTAAHCGLLFKGQVRITTIFNHSAPLMTSTQPIIHPQYNAQMATEGDAGKVIPYDLAFIKVPAGSAPISAIAKLASSPAKKGDPVTILGYGFFDRAKNSILGVRRIGRTTIDTIKDNGVIVTAGAWTGYEDQAMGASIMQGDSGGALYDAETKEIIGVVSANDTKSYKSYGMSLFTNIATEDSISFIQSVMGLDSSNLSTGSRPQADSSNMVGGYSCQQQKGWGKCGESWMTPACDAVCKLQAPDPQSRSETSHMVGGYSCQQQKDWGKCDQPWMYPVCQDICQSHGTEPLQGTVPTQVGGSPVNCSYSKNGKNVQGHSQAECEQLKYQLGL